jgi:hypothetical protein
VHEQDRAHADQQNEDTFGYFEKSNCPKQISLGAVGVDFRSGREHAARKELSDYHGLLHRSFFPEVAMGSDFVQTVFSFFDCELRREAR